jgi:hypothetical protein
MGKHMNSQKGYFPRKKGQSGYQLSAAFVGKCSETIELFLDPGNVHCSNRFDDLLSSTQSKFKDLIKDRRLIIRADSGYGSIENIEKLESIKGIQYITKGHSTRQAAKIARDIALDAYEQVSKSVWIYEIPDASIRRKIIVQTLTKHGKLVYTMLITNLSRSQMTAKDLFYFYNGRQTIEAFFKQVKGVYSIKNLRTRKYHGIYAFLWLVFITHNLITWFKTTVLAGSNLEKISTATLIKKAGRINGYIERGIHGIKIFVSPITKLAKDLLNALSEPSYEQLSFQITPI